MQGNQRSAYRGRLEIVSAILSVCRANSNARKTRIMYQSNLSYRQLQKYLAFLVSMGLLEKENVEGAEFFKLTKKGDEFLNEYHQIKRLLTVGPVFITQPRQPIFTQNLKTVLRVNMPLKKVHGNNLKN